MQFLCARPKHRAGLTLLSLLSLVLLVATLALWSGTTPTVAGPNCATNGPIDSEEQQMLNLINQHRANNGRAPLQFSDTLNKAAQWKSDHMANANYFAHDDTPISRTWIQRIRDCGYGYQTYIGENIAAGMDTAAEAFDAWKNSPGHNANMLGSSYAAIGIGRAYNASSTYDWYWTTEFGGVADGYTTGPSPTSTQTPLPPAATPTPASPPASLPCADFNGDGQVLIVDILYVVAHFNTADAQADIDDSGLVTVTDVIAVVWQYSDICP